MFNHPILIQLLAQDAIEQQRRAAQAHTAAVRTSKQSGSIRKTLASYLVRLGLRLDPAAGGSLSGGGLGAPARKEARRSA